MSVLVIGTSNSILKGGMRSALEEHFGASNVTNLSLGGSSGTFLALCRFIQGIDFQAYKYVFLDSLVNEQWQALDWVKSSSHLKNVARVFYGLLPPGPTYVYMAFVARPRFYRADAVECFHRSLCIEAEVNFIPIREIFCEFAGRYRIGVNVFFQDSSHFKPALIKKFTSLVLSGLSSLSPKTKAACISRDSFFTQDIKPHAVSSRVYGTSLRKQEFGLFRSPMKIKPEAGCFIGFDFLTLQTEAFIAVNASSGNFVKALHFNVTQPWMKIAGFHTEVMTGNDSSFQILASLPTGEVLERTEGVQRSGRPLSGEAQLSTFFFAKIPLSKLGLQFTMSDAVLATPLSLVCDTLLARMHAEKQEFVDLIRSPPAKPEKVAGAA